MKVKDAAIEILIQTTTPLRLKKLDELLDEEILERIKLRNPKSEVAWNLTYKTLRDWFIMVVDKVDDVKFSNNAFNNHFYKIRITLKKKVEINESKNRKKIKKSIS